MKQASCPNCGAGYEPRSLGPLKDKVLHCPYCGHTLDVPDEYEVSREEVFHDGPDSVRKVKVTERRSDIPISEIPFAESFKGGTFDPKSFFDQLKAEGKIPADAEFIPDENGNFVYETSNEDIITHVQKNMGNSVDQIKEMMGDDFTPFGEYSDRIDHHEPGKMYSRSEQRQHSRTTAPKPRMTNYPDESTDPTAIIKWLVFLAVVVLLIVLAIKLL